MINVSRFARCCKTWIFLALFAQQAAADDSLGMLEKLAKANPGPFVIVEGSGKETKSRAQGVIVSTKGHVLSVGHIAWIEADKSFIDQFRVSFRGDGKGIPGKAAHIHKSVFTDREGKEFFEHYFPAKLRDQKGSRFVAGGDLAIFELPEGNKYPKVDFFSKKKPALSAGETLHLCHFVFPHKAGDPTFLINPIEVVGVARTSSGLQYLARGYYRVGSSGGAIIKNGKLIGIQSAAYTINAREGREDPYGLISFELVWGDLVKDLPKAGEGQAEKETN